MMMKIDITALLCICLPLILGAPVDDILKQQIASGLYRNGNDESPYWSLLNPEFLRPCLDVWCTGRDSGNRVPFRRFDSLGGEVVGNQKRFDSLSGATFGNQKRNFDEIDRAGFGSFVKKNFDEIDRNGFGFNKRNFDEIDRTGFGAFVKRGA